MSFVRMPAERGQIGEEVSEDQILGGKLVLRQPLRGHRFGHDAILLAAAVAAQGGERAVELGAGVGAAGLALAHRVAGLDVTLVERDPALAALAAANANRNGLSGRVRAVALDVAAPAAAFTAAGLAPESADHVLMNPPFNPGQNPSPDRARRAAHVASDATLPQWLGTARRLLRSGGALTLIWRADGLADVLAALGDGFGAISVLPIHGKAGGPAIRVLVRASKDRNSPLVLLAGLVLSDADGKPTVEAETVLRNGNGMSLTQN
jgi:tRNA1(Val) A37 N6-methylase TrmN6